MLKKALILSLVLGLPGFAFAKATGPCYVCHTMHYSQRGKNPETESGNFTNTEFYNSPSGITWDKGGPYGELVIGGCFYCHTRQKNGQPGWYIPNVDGDNYGKDGSDGDFGTGCEDPDTTGRNTLAGGTFYWGFKDTITVTDQFGHTVSYHGYECVHNVKDAGLPEDPDIGLTPPGWDPKATEDNTLTGKVAHGESTWTKQLTCAGTYGCHGRHEDPNDPTKDLDSFAGVRGAHHADDSVIDGKSVGTSYRFLLGILGAEDMQAKDGSDLAKIGHGDWEYTVSNTDHNQYYGVDGNPNYSNKHTISYLCAECHGQFHSDIGSSSPWLRHPTDFNMKNAFGHSGDYQDYGKVDADGNLDPSSPNNYDPRAPVAWDFGITNPDDAKIDNRDKNNILSVVYQKENDAIVTCISCHRAHGTPYPDLLRWDYRKVVAGDDKHFGCERCHTSK